MPYVNMDGSKAKMTPWFGNTTRPRRVGVYETNLHESRSDSPKRYSYWDGAGWSDSRNTARYALAAKRCRGATDKFWRGFTGPVEVAK